MKNLHLNNTDNQGTTIEPGCTVVFNQSGELQVGIVKEFKESSSNRTWSRETRDYLSIPVILIYTGTSHVSRVKNSRSVMVVESTVPCLQRFLTFSNPLTRLV